MNRRDALRAAASIAGVSATAGCLGFLTGDGDGAEMRTTGGRPGPGNGSDDGHPALAESGFPTTVCDEPTQPWVLFEVEDPAFDERWPRDVAERYGHDGSLVDQEVVVGLEGGGRPRAYPISILWFHQVVEDDYANAPILVTYNPLCRSVMVASRDVEGETRSFRATGLLWRAPDVYAAAAEADNRSFGANVDETDADVRNTGNLVLVDEESGSYWSQLLARAICGPLEDTALDVVPATVSTWGAWRASNPNTEVLLPPPYSGLDESGVETEGES